MVRWIRAGGRTDYIRLRRMRLCCMISLKQKDWGFNMIRKHVKVEPARWYYHCDKEGILVWQDMPSGDMGNQWAPHTYNGGKDK